MPDRKTLENELRDLETRRDGLEQRLRDARDRQRFSADPESRERALADEQGVMRELDRLMTRTRAVEGQLLRLAGNT